MIRLSDEPAFDFGSPEYRAFFSRFGVTPFQHADWLRPFYDRLPDAGGMRPLILVGRQSDSGELCCVVPLLIDETGRRRRVTFAFLGVTDYACPLIDPALPHRLSLETELNRLVGEHDLRVEPIHRDHLDTWARLLDEPPQTLDFGAHNVVLNPDGTGQGDYAPSQGSSLRRKARRLSELGDVRLEIVRGDEARKAIETARAFRVGRFANDPLEVDPSAAFYAEVAASGNGLSRTFRLMCGPSVVAVMFGLIHGARFHYIILACDYGRFARYSPGLLIMDFAMRRWIDEGGENFDFTIGDEPFKADFGCVRTPMYVIESTKG